MRYAFGIHYQTIEIDLTLLQAQNSGHRLHNHIYQNNELTSIPLCGILKANTIAVKPYNNLQFTREDFSSTTNKQ